MSDSFIKYRLKFNKTGIQKNYILEAQKILNITWSEFSKKLGISHRTLADWKKEKFKMSFEIAQLISKLANSPIPQNYTVIDCTENLRKAGRVGGVNKFIKYGSVCVDEKHRKDRWKNWWENIGKYRENPDGYISILNVKKPRKSKKLAEFVGIMLGDGGISPYHVNVTLSVDEIKYIDYVSNLIFNLFGFKPMIHTIKRGTAVNIVCNRKQMVNFCQDIGLVVGSKTRQQIDIPDWIKENRLFSKECIRGLVDTDGCFFFHKYIVGGKKYSYLKMDFTSASVPLLVSFVKILTSFGFKAKVSKSLKSVRIEDSRFVEKYIKEIGSHNNKHLEKIKTWKNTSNMIE